MNTSVIVNEMLTEAKTAADEMLRKIGGDRYACGYAWVTVYPAHKGNTKAGRAEREILKAMGFRLDPAYGKTFEYWNPSKWGGQNVDVKEAGARAAADVLRKYGFKAHAGSRLD
jgi:hypothetical protein